MYGVYSSTVTVTSPVLSVCFNEKDQLTDALSTVIEMSLGPWKNQIFLKL